MVVQIHRPPEAPPEVDAGVIDDARARQRRQRRAGAALLLAAGAAAGLILGLTSGGGGSTLGRLQHDPGSSPGARAHAAVPQVVATVTQLPPSIFAFGLLAPRVGWVANGIGFYVTRDGGHRWGALSLDMQHGNHYGNVHVPGFDMTGDIGPNITASASPTRQVLVVGFDDGAAAGPCHSTPSVGGGAVVFTSDGGRSWGTRIMPGCGLPTSLSFVSPTTGFALAGDRDPLAGDRDPLAGDRDSLAGDRDLYQTTDGARGWRLVGRVPGAAGKLDFTSAEDGWLLGTKGGVANSTVGLFHTTDGGRSWQRAAICRGGTHAGTSVDCGAPHFFGSSGAVPAVAVNARTGATRTLVYTTTDAGRTWSQHELAAGQAGHAGQGHVAPLLAAPNARDLFVLFPGGALYRSSDGGKHWALLAETRLTGSIAGLDFVSAEYGWVMIGGHFDYTTDGGRAWKPIGSR